MRSPNNIPRRPFLAGVGASMLAGYLTPVLARAEPLVRPPQVLVFDVAESLLDLQTLRPLFERLFGDGAVADEWFGETILYSESATLTNTYTPFGKLGAGVLRMLGHIHGVGVGEAEVAALGEGLAALASHPDTPDSLRKLKSAGYRLVTLTDSPERGGMGLCMRRASTTCSSSNSPPRRCVATNPLAKLTRWWPRPRGRRSPIFA